MELSDVRPSVAKFAIAMESVLREHDGKKPGWSDKTARWLLDYLDIEVKELRAAVADQLSQIDSPPCVDSLGLTPVEREAVDSANFAMFVFDRFREVRNRSNGYVMDLVESSHNGNGCPHCGSNGK